MTINSAIPRSLLPPVSGQEVQPTSPPPIDHFAHGVSTSDALSRRPAVLSSALSALRSHQLQNAPDIRANAIPPGSHSTDSQLVAELEKGFGELHAYFKEGRGSQSSLLQVAAQRLSGE